MHAFRKRRERLTSTATNKGLLNEPGENNCFLNSAIQVLWHLDVFRRSFRLLNGHACMGASCIFCALKNIFQQFQYSRDHALPPNVLRSALAETFHEQNRFQMGLMDDAAECFENILLRIHVHIGNTVREDVCTASHCIPHQKFGLTLVEQFVCPCGATSEPFPFIEMVHYVSATALCQEDETMRTRYGTSMNSRMFGRLIRVAGSWGDMRSCPSQCGTQVEMRKVLMNCPDVVSIGIVWDSEEAQVGNIIDLVNTLGTTLRLSDLFHTVVDEKATHAELVLVGMVCYYGKHYSTFFFHSRLKKWVYFDDAQVSEVGKRWINVIEKCVKGRHQPLLLLYTNPEAHPISTSTAPKHTTMLPGYSLSPSERQHQHHDSDSLCASDEAGSVGGDEESSGTESSMQAAHKPPPLPQPAVSTKHRSSSPRVATDDSLSRPTTTSSRTHIANPLPHSGRGSVRSKRGASGHNSPSSSVASPRAKKPERVVKEKGVARKPLFVWNESAPGLGSYVEPNPTGWTRITPYPNTQKQQQHMSSSSAQLEATAKIEGPAPHATKRNEVPSSRTVKRNNVSVKAAVVGNAESMASFGVMTAVGDRDAASSAAQRQTSPSSSSTSSNANSEMRAPCPSAATRTSSAGHVTTNSGHVTAVEANHTDLRHIDSNSSGSSSNSEHCQPSASLVTCVVNHAIADDDPTLLHPTKPPIPPKPPSLRSSSKHDSIASDDVTTGGEDERRQQLVLTSSTQHEPPHSPEMNRLLAARCVLWLSEADDLIEQSRNADQLMDYSSALQLCLEATKVVERVLTSDNVSHDVLMRARVKHGECINKSQILQRRKNIKQHATEVGRDRMSMVEADRYNTPSNTGDQFSPSTDVVMPPTHPSHSTNQRGEPPPKPSASRLTNERLEIPDIEVLAANDRTASLIDFDKPGITRLQHWVDELYQKQHHNPIRHHPASSFASHPVVGYRPMTSPSTPLTTSTPPDGNLNNNNHLLAASGEHQSAPRSTAETARTNIFVFRRPEDDIAEDDCSEQRKYRSKTPQPSGVADDVSISQQRRAKTPTPSQRKNELRTRLARAQRPNSDVTLRSKYNDWQSVSLDDETVPTAPSRRRGHKSEDVAGKNAEAGHLPPTPLPGFSHLYAMPPAFRAGAPPLFPQPSPGSGIHPAAGLYPPPPMLYPQYLYEMMNYYASLSPEQRSLIPLLHNPPPPNLSAAATNTLTVQPPGYLPPTATTTVTSATSTTAYQELLRARLAQNMKNYSEGMVKPAAPTPQDEQLTNQNIYQMHKPKPHRHNNRSDSNTHSISSKLRTSETPVDDVSTTSGAATAAATTSAALRSSKVARQKPMSSGQRVETAVIDATQGKMKDFQGRQENEASSPVETRCHAREGMLKWADEAKKRPAGVAVPSQYRAKLLQNAVSNRNSPSVDRSQRGSSSSNQPADHWHHANVKSHGASPASPSASTMTSSHGDGGGETKRGESCELCGLAPSAPPGNKYCDSCRAYLGRFKPTANNLPPSKIT